VESDQQIWQSWVGWLQRQGVQKWTAAMLEASGPFILIGAQLIYLGQPVLNVFFAEQRFVALARLLENPSQTQAFIQSLREDQSA
jgi:hypothetical protein